MIKTNRAYEFAKMYYNWVCECLTKDEKFEELVFFKLGVDLAVRQKELIDIKFSQVEFTCVKDIEVKKMSPNITHPAYYPPRDITRATYNLLKKLQNDSDSDKIFNKSSQDYIASIIESIGDGTFNGHMLRRLGTTLHFMKNNKEETAIV